ncbi:hypothetical protein J6590_036525 [Homalodisca vitripennis]|nr:hypothetical protein J6590_036525 [Homalodisca vitripennis]
MERVKRIFLYITTMSPLRFGDEGVRQSNQRTLSPELGAVTTLRAANSHHR